MSAGIQIAAASYLKLGFRLVPLEPGQKLPRTPDWQKNPVAGFEELSDAFAAGRGIGLHHAASGTAVLDVDDLELARRALRAVSIDLDDLLSAPGLKINTSRSVKPLYRLPDGANLKRHALTWKDSDGRAHTVFELRSGLTQDVLPPTVHPNTGQPYTWLPAPPLSREDIPELPGTLLTLWQLWGELKPLLDEASPWAQAPAPPPAPRPKQSGERAQVIGAFNEVHSVRALLELHGYIAKADDRFLAPNSKTGTPGVKLFRDGDTERVYSHHGSDPLADGHSHDAFSVFCTLEHGGDMRAAVKEAAAKLGLSHEAGAIGSVGYVKPEPDGVQPEDWEPMRPLPPTTPEVPTLPDELIPEPFRAWIADAAERACVHNEFLAVPALVSLGSLIGRSLGILPKQRDSWIELPNLWGAIIGPPSVLKSMALDEGSAPLRRLAAEARAAFEAGEAEREAELEVRRLELAQLKKSASARKGNPLGIKGDLTALMQSLKTLEEGGTEKRYLSNDATVEKLGELLRENPRGLLVLRDELTGWLKTLDKPGRENERPFYLEAWNGKGSHNIDRVGRGSLFVPALTLSILGGIQPSKLMSYIYGALEGEENADGLLQRFQLTVWPDAPPEWRNVDRWPDTEAKNRAHTIYKKIDDLKPAELPGVEAGDIPALRFTLEAQELFDDWRGDLMRRIRTPELGRTPAFQSHLAKFPSLFASLALIFHLIDVVAGNASGPVSFGAAALASKWCTYLEAHAAKVYAPELNTAALGAHALAEKIRQGDVEDGTPLRDIYRRQWAGLKSAEQVGSAIDLLQRCAWVRLMTLEPSKQGGRPSDVLKVHPGLRGA